MTKKWKTGEQSKNLKEQSEDPKPNGKKTYMQKLSKKSFQKYLRANGQVFSFNGLRNRNNRVTE